MWRAGKQRNAAPVGVFLLVVGGIVGCAETAPELPPRLEFIERSHDAGKVAQGEPIRHRFTFRNAGERDLRLREVRMSCDCHARIDADEAVAAGATGSIEIEVETRTLSGSFQRTASVISNDPQAPVMRLEVMADVAALVVVEPRELYVGPIRAGTQATAEVHIRFADGSRAELQSLEAEGTVAKPYWITSDDVDAGRRFSVAIAPGAPLGPFVETIVVRTTHPQRPRIEVRTGGVVVEE